MSSQREKPEPRLDRDAQLLLGEKLRGSYDHILKGLPIRLLKLLRGVRDARRTNPPVIAAISEAESDTANLETKSFDPDTLAILEAAFDEAWATLSHIGNARITRDELARHLLDLAVKGERNPARLCARALVMLIASQKAAVTSPGAELPHEETREPAPLRDTALTDPVTPTMWRRETS